MRKFSLFPTHHCIGKWTVHASQIDACCKWPTSSVICWHLRTGVIVSLSDWWLVSFPSVSVLSERTRRCLTRVNPHENKIQGNAVGQSAARSLTVVVKLLKDKDALILISIKEKSKMQLAVQWLVMKHELTGKLLPSLYPGSTLSSKSSSCPGFCTHEPRFWLEPLEWGEFGWGQSGSVCSLCLHCQKYFMVAWAKLDSP